MTVHACVIYYLGASAKQLVIEPSMQDIVLFESKCIGNETILTDCPHSLQSLPCITDSVAGVICLEGMSARVIIIGTLL